MTKTHLSLNVIDVDASTAFYAALFAAEPHKQRPGYANFDLEKPALKLALVQNASAVAAGALNHCGILLDSPEEVEDERRRLGALGLVDNDEGDTVCCHARQDKFWVRDPDGNAWEVYALLDDMLDGVHESPPGAEACCVPAPSPRPVRGIGLPLAGGGA